VPKPQIPAFSTAAAALLALAPAPASAHSFGQVYTLPVPFWLYAWAAAATLVVSFVIAGIFLGGAARPGGAPATQGRERRLPAGLVRALQALSVGLLALCIATGFAGTSNPYTNFNMTFFWIGFVLGFTYLTALVGDVYPLINPWRALGELLERAVPGFTRGRLRYPERAGYAPALALFAAFIWLELLGKTRPFSLAVALSAYTLLNLGAIALVGAQAWFRYGEIFSVMLRLLARLAPVAFAHESGAPPAPVFRLRPPLSGLLQRSPEPASLLVFCLFLLSATAFDGLHQSRPWVQFFFGTLYQSVLSGWVGSNAIAAFPAMLKLFAAWQVLWLLLSPLVYLGAYLAAIALMHRLTGVAAGVLAARFLHALLPIVLVYHVTHYYTLIQVQGVKVVALLSDPFGWGWNLFGTARWLRGTAVPDLATVWHVQVGLILLGHVASVVIAHLEALRLFEDRRTAVLSQLPMLALMVAYTVAGLWILSLPLGAPAPG
jgi:hypothetical protein